MDFHPLKLKVSVLHVSVDVTSIFKPSLQTSPPLFYTGDFIILYPTKIFFRQTFFLYSPYPNLEGIKDVLSYKFRRLMLDRNCCGMCTNEGARA